MAKDYIVDEVRRVREGGDEVERVDVCAAPWIRAAAQIERDPEWLDLCL